MRRGLPAGIVLAATLLLAATGCGGQEPYTLAKTRACLSQEPGVRIAGKVDFVASTALGGAFVARIRSGQQVTIAFGLDEKEAERVARAYRRFRGRNIGIDDVLRPDRNAVLLWKAHPTIGDEATVNGCLS